MNYITIKNVVCTFDLGKPMALIPLTMCMGGRLNSDVFPALVTRCRNTATSVSIFSTGKVVLVGCKTEEIGLLTAHLLVHTLWRKMSLDTSVLNFHVRNIVGKVKLPWALDLDKLYAEANSMPITVKCDAKGQGGISYEPEAFPGIAWPVEHQGVKITFALFHSGGGVATGLKSREHLHIANQILHETQRFEASNEPSLNPTQNRGKLKSKKANV